MFGVYSSDNRTVCMIIKVMCVFVLSSSMLPVTNRIDVEDMTQVGVEEEK